MLGQTVVLDCLVDGVPKPSVSWSKADEDNPGKFHDVYSMKQTVANFR